MGCATQDAGKGVRQGARPQASCHAGGSQDPRHSAAAPSRVSFLSGGIASGKSTVARLLRERGARLIDLDALSREALEPGSETLAAVADEFGRDLLDPVTGELDRRALAARAFAAPEAAQRLEDIELPAIRQLLVGALMQAPCESRAPGLTVVEVPLLDRVEDLLSLADEVIAVVAPLQLRRERAIARGMTAEDFDARVARQPSDAYLRAHATHVIDNSGGPAELASAVERLVPVLFPRGSRER